MSKFCVKKPYTVVVAVVLVLVLGVISFLNMTTDLLPSLELPYVVAVATYPGASPEKVERSVTEVLESAFGTVNGVANLSSVSSENMSLLILEFESSTNMDTAMVDLSTAADQVSGYLPDTVASPMLLRISPDMLPVVVASVDMEGMDIYELTRFVQEDVTPYLERQAGVASVDGTGLVEKTVEVRLDQSRIDALNDKVLASVNDRMADAQAELADAKQKLADGRAELDSAETELEDAQAATGSELGQASAQVDAAVAQASALASQLTGLQASKVALEAERDIRWKAMVAMAQGVDTTDEKAVRDKIEEIAAGMQALYEQLKQPDVPDETPLESLLNGLPDDNPLKASLQALIAQGCTTVGSVKETAKTIGAMPTRLDEIDAALADLGTEILAAEQMKKAADEGLAQAKDYYAQIEAGKIAAAAGFGSGSAQIAAGRTALEEAEAQLEEAEQQLAEARAAALESADITGLLSGQTIAGILTAQNFAMPAGYISGGEGKFMLRIGDEFASLEELENALLVHMDVDGVGDVRLSDVADVVVTDNAADSYARVNGNQAVILSVSKASTAGTSDVSKAVNEAIGELEARYEGLRITPLMDQGQYIKLIVNSVLSNLAWGGALAVLVLALFLKSLRPTLVVAFSIPISVLFALVLMYFSGVTLNIVSLSGLALGVGMLVDNSIVVMENIYRLRSQGMPAARAAVKGAGQVAAAIAASTFTTVCVFLPIVFTEGLTRQLFVDMGLTIAYSLCASLAVALTLVPTLSATLLRREEQKAHPWFDRMVDAYEKALRFCLRHKAVPLAGSLALLALAVWQTTRIGLTFMPEMGGNQMTVSVTVPEGYDRDEAYGLADAVMERSLAQQGVEYVGAVSGSGMALLGGGGSSDTPSSFSFYILLDDEAARDNRQVADAITDATADLGAEISVSTSNMDMSALGGSGMQMRVAGEDLDQMLAVSQDMMELLGRVEGFTDVTNGQEEGEEQLHLIVNKDAAMEYGLTVAQIYSELSAALTTETSATTLTVGADVYPVVVVDVSAAPDADTLLDYTFTTTSVNEEGESVEEEHALRQFATLQQSPGVASINRENQSRYITVSASTAEGYNTSLLSRQVEELLADYQPPEGITVTIEGESATVADAMHDLVLMILLAVVFIYLIMVAQFQSLLSPFIVMFTMPLAFTGGLLALLAAGETLSVIAMLGFLVLAGVVVNNGIVFVDYANQMRLEGMEKREALVRTGRDRIRPILMTALTTILAMATLVFSTDASAAMSRPLALVTIGGLSYATLLTLLVVPVLYDLLFRRELKIVDVED